MAAPSVSPQPAVTVFFSYAHVDEALRNELAKHLSLLENEGLIAGWHDRQIPPGTEWAGTIDAHLENAQIILLLVSADFLASKYCYGIEMTCAMARHEAGDARVIPIILRAADWPSAPFGKLQALPKEGRPVTSWPNQDEAFLDVARGIRAVVNNLRKKLKIAVKKRQQTKQMQKNQAAIELLKSWRQGDEQEQRETLAYLKRALDEDRLSDRKLFL